MLYGRIKTILEYVKAVRSGDIPMNHEILRDCKSLCQRLPVLDSAQFQEDFFDVSQIHFNEPIQIQDVPEIMEHPVRCLIVTPETQRYQNDFKSGRAWSTEP